MKRRSDRELSQIIGTQLTRAGDFSTSALQGVRQKAWDYFLNRPRGDEVDGRSQVQDTTIRDTFHALKSTIMPSYATDHIAQFEPTGQDDEDDAESESDACNNIFTEDNAGYSQLDAAISDAILFRNGVVKVWMEDTTDTITELFEPTISDGQLSAYYTEQGREVVRIDRAEDSTTVSSSVMIQKLRV